MTSETATRPLRVLLVEDNKYDRQFVCEALRKHFSATEVTECEQAEKALRLLRADASSFDVAVVDHVLPGMSGLDFCRTLLAEEIPVPLVILTGRGTEQLAVEALQAGVDDYVVKDLDEQWLELLPLVLGKVVRRHADRLSRQQVEDQLRHATKMEAIGRLASGIAHDFNNLLTGILGHASLLKVEAVPGTSVYDAADTIETTAQRAAELTQKLLGFARKGKHQSVAIDVHALIHDVVALLGRILDQNVRVTLDLRAPRAVALGDPTQMHQVFLNLALNARDAMPEGGHLAFRSDVVVIDERSVGAPPELEHGRHLVVEVADTGCGMAAEVQERIFEPFFTTKDAGQGIGLGLPMVYGIVRNHGGATQVVSEVGRGTTFTVYLPLSQATATAPAESEAPCLPVSTGLILLVDDEQVVRKVAARMLEKQGYEVASVPGAPEAVQYYRQHSDEVAVVIIDMAMPEMDGRRCFLALKEIDQNVKAILTSGYTQNGRVQEALDEGIHAFVQKPFHLGELGAAVRKVLAAGE